MKSQPSLTDLQDEAVFGSIEQQRRLIRLIAWASTVTTPLLFLLSDNPLETATAAFSSVASWSMLFALRHASTFPTALMVNLGVFTVAVLSALAFGSVRNAANFLFVGVVVGAGSFLSRKAFVSVCMLVLLTLSLLTLAESQGLLRVPNQHVGLTTWLVQAMCLGVVALLVYRNRLHMNESADRLREELKSRQRAEQERDRSNERFALIFKISPLPMLVQSARDGAIVDANPAFLACYRLRLQDIVGRDDRSLWAMPEQRESFLQQMIQQGAVLNYACKGLRSDGSTFDALLSSGWGSDPKDKLVITAVTDISEQEASRIRLQRSEERFSKAFNFSPLNLLITRLSDGRIIEANRTGNLSRRLNSEAVRQQTTVEMGFWLTDEARQTFVDKLRLAGKLNAYDVKMRDRDGSVLDFRIWAVLIDIDGDECALSCAVNVTHEKRREALLIEVAQGVAGDSIDAPFDAITRSMSQATQADGVVVSELLPDQQIATLSVWKNGATQPNFVYNRDGKPCAVALDQSAAFVCERKLTEQFGNGSDLLALDAKAYLGQALRDHDGTSIGLLSAWWRASQVNNDEMRALTAIFASRASAELIRMRRDREIKSLNEHLEQRVRERTTELRKLNAELDSFAYSVSHDLKSPLRAIDGFTRLLGEQLEGRLQPDESLMFDRVLASTQRMSSLIADLLALARVSQGDMTRAPTSMSDMADQILRTEQAKQPDRKLQWRIEPGLSCDADPMLLRIALENLLGNAVKYTRREPHPMIEVGQVPGHGTAPAQFFVRDNGVGFNMDHADKLFQPFQRLHTSSEFEGTGIGLATVRRIVERHVGTIRAESAPGQGTAFYFSLSET